MNQWLLLGEHFIANAVEKYTTPKSLTGQVELVSFLLEPGVDINEQLAAKYPLTDTRLREDSARLIRKR